MFWTRASAAKSFDLCRKVLLLLAKLFLPEMVQENVSSDSRTDPDQCRKCGTPASDVVLLRHREREKLWSGSGLGLGYRD